MLDRGTSNFSPVLQGINRLLLAMGLAIVIILLRLPLAHAQAEKLPNPVFAQVFQEIVTYHVNPPSAKQLFYYTVSLIQKQDPYIQTREQNNLVVYYNHKPVFAFRTTGDDDARGWGAIAQAFLEQIYPYSPALQRQTLEDQSQTIINTLVQVLDKYSHVTIYGPKSKAQNVADQNDDPKASIGVTIATDGRTATVKNIVPHSPAQLHLAVGDTIQSIDGKSIAGLKAAQIVSLFRGAPDSKVYVNFTHLGEARQAGIPRALLSQASFNSYVKNDVLYLQIQKFTQGTAQKIASVMHAQPHVTGIVLDLRGNRGGVLSEATAIADLFLATGNMISMRGRHPDSIASFNASTTTEKSDRPIVVLIDGQTASSSEVLAAALQDNHRAVVIGTRSYGKGMVQRATYIEGLGQLAITWAELYKPGNEASLDKIGVAPNICLAGNDLMPMPMQTTPEPGKFVMWFRRAPQVTWDSKTCPRLPRKDKSEDLVFAASLIATPDLYYKALNNKQI
ncbi:MAG: PDZ domain-containing protein [Alphaproteobacteria bacterium]|nr:MAG: PDZ domain-containing protein [Alphaproteobacteria bacterium]